MKISLAVIGLLVVSSMASAQPPAVMTPSMASCEQQLVSATEQNATVLQLWRDIDMQRRQHEIQMASIRSKLQNCSEQTSVSQCVADLAARYQETSAKLAKAVKPVEPKTAEGKK